MHGIYGDDENIGAGELFEDPNFGYSVKVAHRNSAINNRGEFGQTGSPEVALSNRVAENHIA